MLLCIKLWSHCIKYRMGIIIFSMPTGLMLAFDKSKCKVEICNFDILFYNQNNSGAAILVCSNDKNFVY